MTRREISELLGRSEYFRGLSRRGRGALASVCAVQDVARRRYLFLEGRKGEAVFVLVAGAIQLLKTSEDGKDIVIKTVEPGEVFAEVVLFEQDAYPVSALAIRKSRVLKLPRREFARLLGNRAFRDDFVASLMRRLRYLADRILYLTAYDVETRFFRFLQERYGGQPTCRITMSKKDIASAIGTVPETFSRLILRLGREGKISWRGRDLRISR